MRVHERKGRTLVPNATIGIISEAASDHTRAFMDEFKINLLPTGCAATPCSKQIFSQNILNNFAIFFHNSKPGKWFLLIG